MRNCYDLLQIPGRDELDGIFIRSMDLLLELLRTILFHDVLALFVGGVQLSVEFNRNRDAATIGSFRDPRTNKEPQAVGLKPSTSKASISVSGLHARIKHGADCAFQIIHQQSEHNQCSTTCD